MFKACGVRVFGQFKDSIIIRQGPFTIYPIAKHHDSVQWHVVVGELKAFFEKSKVFPILSLENDVRSFYSGGYMLTGNNVNSIRTFLG